MKKIYNKIKNNILKYTIISLISFIVISFILYLIDIRFRLWFIILVSLIIMIGFILSIIKVSLNESKLKKTVLISSLVIMITICLIISKIVIVLLSDRYKPEYAVKLYDKRYVAVVNKSTYVDVDYYNYYGPILMGTKVKVHGYFGKGDFDPFTNRESIISGEYSYYDNNGKIVKLIKKTHDDEFVKFYVDEEDEKEDGKNNNTVKYNYVLPEEQKVLYEEKFGKTILRVTKVDNALGQNMIVDVLKSTDNGENFYRVTDEAVQVSLEAKFKFLNEKLGFAISTGKINLKSNISGLYVTEDSGKTFKTAVFKYENSGVEYIDINGLPYFEKESIKLNCSVYKVNPLKGGYEDVDLIFVSDDNGLTWNLEEK